MNKCFAKLWDDESGQDLTEYVLLIVLISLAATAAALTALGGAVSTGFQNAASEVTNQT
jgi:Flp pilus assembly pilin Flp